MRIQRTWIQDRDYEDRLPPQYSEAIELRSLRMSDAKYESYKTVMSVHRENQSSLTGKHMICSEMPVWDV